MFLILGEQPGKSALGSNINVEDSFIEHNFASLYPLAVNCCVFECEVYN